MKKTVHWMALMVLTASGNALAAGINSVMDLVDAKKISTLEQLLPQLPHDLRSNFVTVSQSRSLQEAAPDKPRVIMFGEDAKLIIAFNGAPLKGSDKLEIIQFNEADSRFDFFELGFPIKRDEAGKAVRPEKNPTTCTVCHGTNPHPIWAAYNNWPGMYGANDDFLEGDELKSFESFLSKRDSMERYRALEPLTGSPLSPFSHEKRSNYKFRPNVRLTLLLPRYEAKRIAASIRESAKLGKYAALLAYENESEKPAGTGTGYPKCESLYTQTPIYDGLWTPEDSKTLYAKFELERKVRFPASPPIPGEWQLVKDLFFLFSNESAAAWSLALEGSVDKPTEFRDGNSTFRTHVLSELREDIFALIPELRAYAVSRSRYKEDSPNPRLVRTPYDVAFLKSLDSIEMFISFKSDSQVHCRLLINRIKKDWF